jgi:hypothetical protein
MILIVTCREDLTSDFVIIELRRRGIPYFRFNTEDFPIRCVVRWRCEARQEVELCCHGKPPIPMADITSVWYRRPKRPDIEGFGNDLASSEFIEAEANAALQNLWWSLDHALWVSHPDRIRQASHRIVQLNLARKLGFTTPRTIVSNDACALLAFYDELEGEVVAKTLHHQASTVCEPYVIYTTKIARDDIDEGSMSAPVLLQEYIPKGRELRVTVVDTKVFAVALNSQSVPEASVDWRKATLQVPHERVDLPASVSDGLVSMLRHFGLRFGAFDFIETPDGNLVFLELNPNGQWAWLQQLTGVPIKEALVDLLATGKVAPNSRGAL